MFPLWPVKLRLGVYYLSMSVLGLIILFFAMALFRLFLFVITMFTVPPGLWLYPNLFEDVGFFDSFRPLWGWQEVRNFPRLYPTILSTYPSSSIILFVSSFLLAHSINRIRRRRRRLPSLRNLRVESQQQQKPLKSPKSRLHHPLSPLRHQRPMVQVRSKNGILRLELKRSKMAIQTKTSQITRQKL